MIFEKPTVSREMSHRDKQHLAHQPHTILGQNLTSVLAVIRQNVKTRQKNAAAPLTLVVQVGFLWSISNG